MTAPGTTQAEHGAGGRRAARWQAVDGGGGWRAVGWRAAGRRAATVTVLVVVAGVALSSVADSPLLMVAGPLVAVAGWSGHRHRSKRRQAAAGATQTLMMVDVVIQHLRSGHSLGRALRQELPSVALACRQGASMEHALAQAVEAADGGDRPQQVMVLRSFQILSRRGGGNLASLERLSDTLRSAEAVAAEVRANAAQASASALTLAFLPLVFAVFFAAVDRRMAHFYLREPLGAALAVAAGVCTFIGWRWMQRIIGRRSTLNPSAAGRNAGASVTRRWLRWIWSRGWRREPAMLPSPPVAALPAVLDLSTVVLGAGGTIRDAVEVVALSGPIETRPHFAQVLVLCDQGAPLAEGLNRLQQTLGLAYQPLTGALLIAHSQGGPVAPLLARMAIDANRARRQHGEAQARRLPVLLLIPLVVCSLPAVVLGAVIPMILVALRHLSL